MAAEGARLGQLADAADFLLRLAFFGFAPFALVLGAQLFPITGAVIQIGLALGFFVAGEAARGRLQRAGVLAELFSSSLAFESYYRERAPRPFLYYVFYPLLFPYWLAARDARREFLLYKGYTATSFALLLGSLGFQFARAFPPELSFRDFLPIAAGSLIAEAVAVLMFLMPIVTSIVHFHRRRAPRRLAALLCAALISIGFAGARLERRRDPIVSYATRVRVWLRTQARPRAAERAQQKALAIAWRALPQTADDVDSDGKVEAEPLAIARDTLQAFYKNDEAHAFDLWYTKLRRRAMLVLYFEAHRGHAPIWLAMDDRGTLTHDEARLPKNAFAAMRHAAR